MITLTLLAVVVLLLVAYADGAREIRADGRLARVLASRGIVAFVFAATFLALWYTWASWNPQPVVHDEMAYVLQAQIFARGAWGLPSPPLPAFWQQPHVLVEPVLTSKYFPGHSLLMTPGVWLGWPALVPLLEQSAIAALLFVLARRVASGAVALLAWSTWLFTPMVLYFGPAFYSEATTTLCWLAGWYALLQWRTTRSAKWLAAVALCTGWGAITRPLTGLAYAIPIAFVVLRDVIRLRAWRDLAIALATGTAVVSILAIWSANTTGDWRLTPQTLYTRMYMPYDVPGFGMDSTPPQHSVTPELAQLNNVYSSYHATHVPSRLPAEIASRARSIAFSTWETSAGLLAVFALLGLLTLTRETAFALASCVTLFAAYLLYATPPQWTLYYYETGPTLACVTAAGMAWAASKVGNLRKRSSDDWRSRRWLRALACGTALLALPGLVALRKVRAQHIGDRLFLAQFNALLSSIHDERAVLFVRHSGMHNPHRAFVRNVADLDRERVWVVYDRGEAENARLLARAPGRTAYLFDEEERRTYIYDPR